MNIEAYAFGRMEYGGKTYTSDLIIYPDRVDDSWRRLQGHLLQIEDLENILKAAPDILVIGTGNMGVMKVPPRLIEQLENKNIRLFVEPTAAAVKTFNDFNALNSADKSKRVIGAFHLTC